ncbi:MAG: hypothetical protein ACK4MX_07050 [Thermaurantiacus sp.]
MESFLQWVGALPFEAVAVFGGIAALVALRRSMRRAGPNRAD